MPIEVMAEGHKDSLRHGPMKPMGLTDPRTGQRPYAVIQLRQDDKHATLYNMVGFQTRMTYPAQEAVFRTIPGLAQAKFARLGSMHRNTYINGPRLLDEHLQLKEHKGIYVAGQLTGVEGYLESAATGIYAGMVCKGTVPLRKGDCPHPPPTTAIGALIGHITHGDEKDYQPMKVMWGIFAPLAEHPSTRKGPKKAERRRLLIERARRDFKKWMNESKLF
jgi:methylenetetrahydrofolate--tRNA-(uracil-5-)-methyltransferase